MADVSKDYNRKTGSTTKTTTYNGPGGSGSKHIVTKDRQGRITKETHIKGKKY